MKYFIGLALTALVSPAFATISATQYYEYSTIANENGTPLNEYQGQTPRVRTFTDNQHQYLCVISNTSGQQFQGISNSGKAACNQARNRCQKSLTHVSNQSMQNCNQNGTACPLNSQGKCENINAYHEMQYKEQTYKPNVYKPQTYQPSTYIAPPRSGRSQRSY